MQILLGALGRELVAERVSFAVEGSASMFLVEGSEEVAVRCIEEEHCIRVEVEVEVGVVAVVEVVQHNLVAVGVEEEHCAQEVVGSSVLTAVVVCNPVLVEESNNLVEGCAGVVRNVYGLSLRNAKHCKDRYLFCHACFLLLCLHFLGLHHYHQEEVGYEDVGACFHPESSRMPMRQRLHQRQAEARRHFR